MCFVQMKPLYPPPVPFYFDIKLTREVQDEQGVQRIRGSKLE